MSDLQEKEQDYSESLSPVKVNVDIDLAKAVGALISPVNKIIDMFGNACGIIGDPLRKILTGKADAYVMNENAKIMESHKCLPIDYHNDNFSISTKTLDSFHQRMLQREWCQAEQREMNIEKIIKKAIEKVKNEPKVDTQYPDQDWLLRFFTSAQDISTEEMQNIWADILAGTAKNSKAYSLRTLTTLHSMSKYDAELFKRVCSHLITVLNYVFLPRYDNSVKETSVSYQEILHLSECGLLNQSPMVTLTLSISNVESSSFILNEKYVLLVTSKKEKGDLQIPQYPLTIPGREIASLFKQQTALEDIKTFATFIMKENKNVIEQYSMHKILEYLDNNQISYDPTPLVSV